MTTSREHIERWRHHRPPAARHWPRDPDDLNTHPGSDPEKCDRCKAEKEKSMSTDNGGEEATPTTTTGHAWAGDRCVNCGVEAPRPWAETCNPPGLAADLSLALRKAARDHLELAEGAYWPSEVAAAQATALLDAGWRILPPEAGDPR